MVLGPPFPMTVGGPYTVVVLGAYTRWSWDPPSYLLLFRSLPVPSAEGCLRLADGADGRLETKVGLEFRD